MCYLLRVAVNICTNCSNIIIVLNVLGMHSAGKIQMSERTKQHLDETARDQFIVELRQPKVTFTVIIVQLHFVLKFDS